jgi:hypothetical protein
MKVYELLFGNREVRPRIKRLAIDDKGSLAIFAPNSKQVAKTLIVAGAEIGVPAVL